MLNELFFRTVGFFVEPGFLDAAECSRLRMEADRAPGDEAGVVRGADIVIDRDHRRTKRADLEPASDQALRARMQQMRTRLASHFAVRLEDMQPLQLLVYGSGDFFGLHTDSKSRPEVPDFLSQRKVSVVVFLGHEGVSDTGSQGGLLQFHGLLDDPRLKSRAYSFCPEPGTLLAFRSHVLHEVTPVLGGVRYSLVTWFC